MSTDLKIYDKIRALAGNYKIMHNDVEWTSVLRYDEILRGQIITHPHDYSEDYLTIESLEDGNTIWFKKLYNSPNNTFSYSLDDGTTWTSVALGTPTGNYDYKYVEWTLDAGEKVLLKANAYTWANISQVSDYVDAYYWSLDSRKTFKTYGNIMSMFYGDNFSDKVVFPTQVSSLFGMFAKMDFKSAVLYQGPGTSDIRNLVLPATTLSNYCYMNMFDGCTSLTAAPKLPATTLSKYCYAAMLGGCTSLTSAPELPATTLAQHCYDCMFYGCTSLTSAPELPATTLADGCYYQMFEGCTSLTSAPELLATTLVQFCYFSMFNECTSLTAAPELPATTLALFCYQSMFEGCTSLTSAPELPATTLALQCYWDMFKGCTSLTTAPELPATTLVQGCYYEMFYGCSSLNYIKCLATDISAQGCLNDWVVNVQFSGTFVKDASMTDWSEGVNGIPYGWTVQNA